VAGALVGLFSALVALVPAQGSIAGPPTIDDVARDAESISVDVAVTSDDAAAVALHPTLTVGDATCELADVSVVADRVQSVTVDLTGCAAFADAGEDVSSVTLTLAGVDGTVGEPLTLEVPLSDADGSIPWSAALKTPFFWGIVAFGLVVLLGGAYALTGCKMSQAEDERYAASAKKLLPHGQTWRLTMPWNLPAKPMSGLDFGTSGIAGKLVFVGAAITTVLALGDQLDSVLSNEQQTAFAVANVIALLVAGAAPLIVLGLQARYRPVWPTAEAPTPTPPSLTEAEAIQNVAEAIRGRSAEFAPYTSPGDDLAESATGAGAPAADNTWLALADEQLVASVPGVVLGSAVTAAAVTMQVAALQWAAEQADVGWWTDEAALVLAIGVSVYCVTVAGSIAVNGRRPPLIDRTDDSANASPTRRAFLP
jgi:hypothetical protein